MNMALRMKFDGKRSLIIEGDIEIEFTLNEIIFDQINELSRQLNEYKEHLEYTIKSLNTKTKTHEKLLLSVTETASYLGMARSTIYNKICRGSKRPFPVKPKRVGKSIKFDIRELDDYLNSI
jgi:predicted DNA-binding transcriptional regulator AlpA